MKKLLLFLALAHTVGAAAPDLVKGYDFTGTTSITGAKLNQLVDNAYVGANRGLVIYTNSAPSVAGEAKLARYLWLDTNFTPPTPKVWNTNTSAWVGVSATAVNAANSITAAMMQINSINTTNLQDNSVTTAKIAALNVTSGKIAVGGVDNTNIIDLTITGAKIAASTIATANLIDASVTGGKLAANSVSLLNLTNGFLLPGTNIAVGTITSSNLATNAVALTNISMGAGSSNQVIRINAGGTALEYGADQYLFRSTNITIIAATAAVTVNYAHGLGGLPDNYNVYLVSTGVNAGGHGYAAGDTIPFNLLSNNAGQPGVMTVSATTSTFTVYKENAGHALSVKTTGAVTALTDVQLASDFTVRIVAVRYNQ